MSDKKTILIVARTEAKLFARSWIFRFFALITFIILGFFNWAFFMPKSGISGMWMLRSISSSIPYFNFLFLTVLQSLIVIFGAVDSLQRDFKLDTFENLHARAFTNLRFLTGKVLGIMIPCLIMNLLTAALALIVTGIFVDDVPIVWQAYIIYPFLLSFPALLFMTSLSFAVMSILRNKPLSLLILVGYFILTFLFNEGITARFIDFTGIHLPLLYSSFVGLDNWASVLFQRGFFIFAAFGSIMISALFFTRLSQSAKSRQFSTVFSAIFITFAVILGALFAGNIHNGIKLRERIRTLNEQYVSKPRAKLTRCGLDVIHTGSRFDVTAKLTLLNPRNEQLNSVYFSLNPGFNVTSVTSKGTELEFTRDTQILDINLQSPLIPGEETELTISYEGTLNDEACYSDIETAERIKPSRLFTYVINKRYGFISKDYILLTPECQWYPISGVPFGMIFPNAYEKDFIDFTLDITTGDSMAIVSQGAVEKTGTGQFTVRPETKLPGLTLAAGDYEKKAIEVDGVELAIYHRPGHDYFSNVFKADIESIIAPIERYKLDYDNNKGMKYPFPRYSIVESPVQFHAYERPWSTYMETGQPSMSIVPEKGFFLRSLDIAGQWAATQNMYKQMGREIDEEQYLGNYMYSLFVLFMSDGAQRNSTRAKRTRPPSGLSLRTLFMNMFEGSFIPGYTLSSQYYPFLISFESEKYPVFNTVMEFYRKHGLNINMQMNYNRMQYPLRDEEIACMALERDTFANFLEKGTDFDTLNMLIMLKANHLFGQLQAESGNADFGDFLDEFIKEHTFESVKYEEFAGAVEEKYSIDMDELFEIWYNESRMPMFTISDATLTEILDGDFTCYQTTFTITNTETVPGTVWIQLQQPGTTVITQTRATRFIKLEGNQTKEIGVVTETPPPYIGVNTMISKNIPIMFSRPLGKPKVDQSMKPFEGERIVEYSPPTPEPGTIVVDNLDEGFEIISESEDKSDDNKNASLYKFGQYPDDFIASVPSMPPQRWGKAVFETAYGMKATACYTKNGDGEGCVAWNAEISEEGNYDLEFFLADFSRGIMRFASGPNVIVEKKTMLGEYNLTVKHAGQDNSVTFIPNETQPGWQYVSSFDLSPGKVCVELSNKSTGMLVYADAIRWVKK
ncbi:hypothetical protein ACFL6H_04695 [Candidatus Latescibacterota bacterium]